jgi:hypothetical protein
MDISPMSLQAVIPRSSETTQVQHNLNQQTAVQQDYQAMQDKAEMRLKEKSVQTKDNPEDGRVKDDPNRKKGQGNYQGNGHKRKQEEEKEGQEKMAVDVMRGHHIDISL